MRVGKSAGLVAVLFLAVLALDVLPAARALPAGSTPWNPKSVIPGSNEMKLGRGYQLQNTDVLKPGIGVTIFDGSKMGACFVETPLNLGSSSVSSYESTEEFRKELASEASLEGSYGPVSLQASVKYATNSATTKNIKVAELKGYRYTAAVQIDDDCLSDNPLSKAINSAFKQLPVLYNNGTVQLVLTDTTVRPYIRFFLLFGNHIITGFNYGATYRFFATTTDTSESAAQELQINACLSVNTGSASVKGCENFKKGDSSKTTVSVASSNVLKVGGDDSDTSGNTPLSTYLQTGSDIKRRTPALYQFKPIWEVLDHVYGGSPEDIARVTTMKALYEGWVDQGCNTLSLDGVEQRRFVLEPYKIGQDDMVFKCLWPPRGCRNDNGCAHRWQGGDDRCICCGPDCIVTPRGSRHRYIHREPTDCNPNTNNDDHYFDWQNNGACPHNTCFFDDNGGRGGCHCRNGNQWYLKWSSGQIGDASNVQPVPPEDCNTYIGA